MYQHFPNLLFIYELVGFLGFDYLLVKVAIISILHDETERRALVFKEGLLVSDYSRVFY